mgnify:FL=1
MKKSVLLICVILIVIIIICSVGIWSNIKKVKVQKQANIEYEKYLDKDLYGTDVATILNKATNENKQNNVEKQDEKYIDNNINSILIDLVMITNEKKEKTKSYRMETIEKVGINEFIKNFNTAKFKITKMEYHKQTGKIKYIEISQQYE